ncbi:MAG TPA: CDP-alcohol phosphatidyltransferase family protein [Bryobacteraceae bacterium]|nr:CDP-alcohol phosphatidyltransferase family protein [Bryobacteraceae bacterium]
MNPWLLPPNLLSLARILMTPVIAWRLGAGDPAGAFPWIVAASLTDLADGQLARRFNWTSDLGRKLDPAADKLMLAAVYAAMAAGGLIPVWIAGLVIGRDLVILSFAAWAAGAISLKDFKPSAWGKLSTLLQMLYVAVVSGLRIWPDSGVAPFVTPLLWATAAATLASGIGYAREGWALARRQGD